MDNNENITKNVQTISTKVYNCIHCNKIFLRKFCVDRHEINCKYKNDNSSEIKILKEKLEQKDKEFSNYKIQLLDIINKTCKIHPKTLQKINKQLINNGTINNTVNNINIVKFGTEDIASILSQSEILKILNRKMYYQEDVLHLLDSRIKLNLWFNLTCSLEESIKAIHFNDNRPEFKNIYITNLKDQYAYIFDGTKFIAGLKSDILGELVDNHVENIEYSTDEL